MSANLSPSQILADFSSSTIAPASPLSSAFHGGKAWSRHFPSSYQELHILVEAVHRASSQATDGGDENK
jgi:hypothetical protein